MQDLDVQARCLPILMAVDHFAEKNSGAMAPKLSQGLELNQVKPFAFNVPSLVSPAPGAGNSIECGQSLTYDNSFNVLFLGGPELRADRKIIRLYCQFKH